MEAVGARAIEGIESTIAEFRLPWHAGPQLGARVTYHFTPEPALNMTQYVHQVHDDDLTYLMNLYMLNRGMMCMAFNNVWLMSPSTTEEDIDQALGIFHQCCRDLVS
jgi:glutamate-1-semialdehyde aminotransferase